MQRCWLVQVGCRLHGVGAVVAGAAVHVALVLVVVVVAAVVLRLLGHTLAAAAEQVAVSLLEQGQVQQPAAGRGKSAVNARFQRVTWHGLSRTVAATDPEDAPELLRLPLQRMPRLFTLSVTEGRLAHVRPSKMAMAMAPIRVIRMRFLLKMLRARALRFRNSSDWTCGRLRSTHLSAALLHWKGTAGIAGAPLKLLAYVAARPMGIASRESMLHHRAPHHCAPHM